jgi:hypothetical protein
VKNDAAIPGSFHDPVPPEEQALIERIADETITGPPHRGARDKPSSSKPPPPHQQPEPDPPAAAPLDEETDSKLQAPDPANFGPPDHPPARRWS